ncbi:hypothetical protein QZH41_000614 [Actinostola sp. cb2023]|nr:hypothetical protein QZH41_000614 [Actinostola sp. cb2023]
MAKLTNVKFIMNSLHADTLYFDLVRFVTTVKLQTRDAVVRQVGESAHSNDPPLYDDKDFWQQSLRWHETRVPKSAATLSITEMKEIHRIEEKLDNWYASVDETLSIIQTKVADNSVVEIAFNPIKIIYFQEMKVKRWLSLKTDIEAAHSYFDKIKFDENRPTLFPEASEFGEDGITDYANDMTKFGFIFLPKFFYRFH